jgi:predicted MFS family arabinose efflux permease
MQGHLRRGFGPRISTWAVVIDPTHVRAYVLVTALMMSSFMIAPFIATFLVKNLGQPENDLYLVYLTGGFATLVSLPLVGRLADRLGKLIVFQVSALAIIVPILVLVRLTDVSFAVCVVVTTLFMIFASGRMVPGMALITGCALPRYRGSFLSVNSSVQQAAAGLAAMLTGLLTRTGPDHSIIGFTQVGSIAAVFALASVVLGARLKPADETVAPLREERLITSEEGATATVALALLRARGRETPPLDTPLPAPAE